MKIQYKIIYVKKIFKYIFIKFPQWIRQEFKIFIEPLFYSEKITTHIAFTP